MYLTHNIGSASALPIISSRTSRRNLGEHLALLANCFACQDWNADFLVFGQMRVHHLRLGLTFSCHVYKEVCMPLRRTSPEAVGFKFSVYNGKTKGKSKLQWWKANKTLQLNNGILLGKKPFNLTRKKQGKHTESRTRKTDYGTLGLAHLRIEPEKEWKSREGRLSKSHPWSSRAFSVGHVKPQSSLTTFTASFRCFCGAADGILEKGCTTTVKETLLGINNWAWQNNGSNYKKRISQLNMREIM